MNIDNYKLEVGAHATFEDGVCAMELVAHLAGEPHSDAPECTSLVIAAFTRGINDQMPDEVRHLLLPTRLKCC